MLRIPAKPAIQRQLPDAGMRTSRAVEVGAVGRHGRRKVEGEGPCGAGVVRSHHERRVVDESGVIHHPVLLVAARLQERRPHPTNVLKPHPA